MLLVRLPVNSKLLIVRLLESQELHVHIQLDGGGEGWSVPLTPGLFKGQLYIIQSCSAEIHFRLNH